jgi:site-specific recombinase XerD
LSLFGIAEVSHLRFLKNKFINQKMNAMRSTFKTLFYIKKKAVKNNGKAPIMARVTVNGEVAQFSLKCEVAPTDWDPRYGKAIGKSSAAQKLNGLLDNYKASIINHYREISDKEPNVTAEKVKNAFLGFQNHNEMLLDLFTKYNQQLEFQIGKCISRDTYQKYLRTAKRLEQFVKYKYNVSDISIKEINHSFVCDFDIYLKTVHSCCQNTTAKFMQRFKTIILIAKNNGWISSDPYSNYKLHFEKSDREFLTEQELEEIMKKKFTIKRLEQVRDIFIFSCFTGLAYIDVYNLRKSNIRNTFDDSLWIIGKRIKTNVTYRVPLLDIPKSIIEKYSGTLPDDLVLPVISNQKMNSYLKEIADACGISKNLSFHAARHTFATTVTLSKGVSIESVSKMLGHTNIKTTQIYARITDNKIKNDMVALASKIKNLETSFAAND